MDQYDAIPDELRERAEAVKAERERCAHLVDQYAKAFEDDGHGMASMKATARVLNEVAKAIRGDHQ